MNAIPYMSVEEIRALKARMDFASKRIEAEAEQTPADPVRNREIAAALTQCAWERGWRPHHDPERVAEKIRILKLLHGSSLQSAA